MRRPLKVGDVVKDHFVVTDKITVEENGKNAQYIDLKCTKCGADIKNIRTTSIGSYCIRHEFECSKSPFSGNTEFFKRTRSVLEVGHIVKGHFLVTARNTVKRNGKKLPYISLKCTKCGTEIKHVRTVSASYYCMKHDLKCTGHPITDDNNEAKYVLSNVRVIDEKPNEAEEKKSMNREETTGFHNNSNIVVEISRNSSLQVGNIVRDHFLVTDRAAAERNGKKVFYVNLKCTKCGAEIKAISTKGITYWCAKHDTECPESHKNKIRPVVKHRSPRVKVGSIVRDHFLVTARNVVESNGKKAPSVDIKCTKCGAEIKNVRVHYLTERCRIHDNKCTGSPSGNKVIIDCRTPRLDVGSITRDHFLITGRNVVEQDGRRIYYIDLKCTKCGAELKHVRWAHLSQKCEWHDKVCAESGNIGKKVMKTREPLNVGDTTRGCFLITAKRAIESHGRKFYCVDLKCKRCGAELKNVRTTTLAYYCWRHERDCTGSPYYSGATIASKETPTTVGNSKAETTKTGRVDLPNRQRGFAKNSISNMSKFRTVRIPNNSRPGCAKTEKRRGCMSERELNKTVGTVIYMERKGNIMPLKTVNNENAFEEECRLCYDKHMKEGVLCPLWVDSYETFREWYRKNIPKMPNSFMKYRIYLTKRNNTRLIGPDNVIICCFSILN